MIQHLARAAQAGLWLFSWEGSSSGAQNASRRNATGVEFVMTHRSKKEKQEMSLFERVVTEGHERADELAKDGAMPDGETVAQIRGQHSSAEKRGGVHGFAVCS